MEFDSRRTTLRRHMDEMVEMNLSRAVSITDTGVVRSHVRQMIDRDQLSGPPVELIDFHVFIHCTAGAGRHMVDFVDYEMRRGTAIWIRPGQVQRWSDKHDGFDADVVVFASSSIPDLPLFNRLDGTTTAVEIGDDADKLQTQMEWMSNDLASNQDEAVAASVVGVILRLFARHAGGQSSKELTPASALTKAFIESVEQNIEQRSVAWHARQIGASTRSVARATAAANGQRPKDIIDERVVLEAQRRLAWSKEDISTISRALHFSEASNFTKYFRSRTGLSPTAFRNAVTSL